MNERSSCKLLTFKVESQPKLPYEMYFLMDGSRSMLAALDSVKTNSKELARRVTEAWDRSKVGLGLFNDKEAIPFTFVNLTTTKLVKNIPEFVSNSNFLSIFFSLRVD